MQKTIAVYEAVIAGNPEQMHGIEKNNALALFPRLLTRTP
jgi:hypothetical protein